VATYLDEIIAAHRATAAADGRSVEALLDQARAMPASRSFRPALADGGLSVIAEIKRRSPSKGDLAPDLDPAVVAKGYADGGAACLSVLTDQHYFGGSADDLAAARGAVDLPALRKDFTVSEADVVDARIMGADAVLLIVAALEDAELVAFRALAEELGLAVLVETHDEAEVERALAAGADLIGVNQRDLRTFEVDPARAVRVRAAIPPDAIAVAESGIHTTDDVARLRDAGYAAILVGESLVTAADSTRKLQELLGCS
jgi:indole-3-glycerol phosphate synthase